jgi:hypothetical protein
MKRSRYTEEQIIGILKEAVLGITLLITFAVALVANRLPVLVRTPAPRIG